LALLLYIAATVTLIALWRRWLQPISIGVSIILILLPLCFTGRALLTGRVYAPIDLPLMVEPLKDYAAEYGIERVHNGTLSDLYVQIIPWAAAVRHALRNGEWPLWNPYMLCGDILAAAAQPAVYDPFNALGLLIALPASVTFATTMTFFLCGLFAFSFARAIGSCTVGSLICAAGWMFSGNLAFFAGWPLARAWAYLPLVLFAVRLLVWEVNVRATIILTIAFVLLILAGHPESILHVVAIGAAYSLFEIFQRRERGRRAIVAAMLAGGTALLLCAIYLLPFLASAPETREHFIRTQVARDDFPTNKAIIGRRLANTFVPFWGGQPWRQNTTADYDPQTARVGSVLVAMTVLALVLARRRRETWFFAGLLLVSLCIAAEAPPFAHLLHEIPLFDMALNERFMFAASFAFCVLAAIGASSLTENHGQAPAICMALVAAALALLAMFLWPIQQERGVERSLMGLLTIVELLPLALLLVLFASTLRRRAIVVIAFALVLSQRYIEDGTIYPAIPSSAFYPTVPLLDYVRTHHGDEPARVVGWQWAMIPNMSAVFALDDPRGYEAMTFRRLFETYPLWSKPESASFNRVEDLSLPFLSMMNTRFAITSKDAKPPEGWRIVAEDRTCRVMENSRALPRAFIPQWIRYEQNDIEVLHGMAFETDFGNMGWIRAPEYEPHLIANGPGALRTRRNGRRFDIAATMMRDGWVVVSETAWNGWRAYVDGRRVRLHYANHAFLGVFVPAGSHTVRLEYWPEAFTRGRNITLVTLLALIALAVATRIRRPRQGL
jgi:hypothetical protein